jgi:hypothetical protein
MVRRHCGVVNVILQKYKGAAVGVNYGISKRVVKTPALSWQQVSAI